MKQKNWGNIAIVVGIILLVYLIARQSARDETSKVEFVDESIIAEESIATDKNQESENNDQESEAEPDTTRESGNLKQSSQKDQTTAVEPVKQSTIQARPKVTIKTEPPVALAESEIKVYLYEWGLDLSKKEIPAGKITFIVSNNGRFTHSLAIKSGKHWEKVKPGHTSNFTTLITDPGLYTLYSYSRNDYDMGMKENFRIIAQ